MTISVAGCSRGYHQDPKLDESAIAGVLPDTGFLKNEQARIEGQLTGFEKSLWYQPDTTQVAVDSKAAKKAAKRSARKDKGSTKEAAPEKAAKVKAPKAEKSAPVRSVRRRR